MIPTITRAFNSIPPTLQDLIIAFAPLLIFVFLFQAYLVWVNYDAEQFVKNLTKKSHGEFNLDNISNEEWDNILKNAELEVQALIKELPEEIRLAAESIPCIFEPVVRTNKDGLLTLGIFKSYPKSIYLYLGSILIAINEYKIDINHQIRKTYLHELAHGLGLNEEEVRLRGLA